MSEHLPSWLRRLVGNTEQYPRKHASFLPEVLHLGERRRQPTRPSFRPSLEILEVRLVPAAPTITDPTATGINAATALLGGNVTDSGGAPVTTCGIVYSLTSVNPNPTIGGTGVIEVDVPPAPAPGTGMFTAPVAPLTPNSGYSFAAFATNSDGTSYTTVTTFTTTANPVMPTGAALVSDPSQVLFLGPSSGPGMVPLKTITFTNNDSTTVYPFLEDPNTTETAQGSGIALYDPNDAYNQEYRAYIGYSQNGVNYFGVLPGMTVTISVPLVFWNGGRIDISDDPTYLVTNQTVQGPFSSQNPFQYYAYQAGSTPQNPQYTLASIVSAQSSSGGPAGVSGVVMYYHSLVPNGPANDAPSQLLEFTIRDTYLGTLSTANLIPNSEKHPLVNYDVSYVDSMALPVAMEATDVPVPVPNPNNPAPPPPPTDPPLGPRLAYGWVGSDQTAAQFQASVQNFTSPGAANGLGTYFGGISGIGGTADGSTSKISFTQSEIQSDQAELQNLTVGMLIGTNISGYSIPPNTMVTGIIHQDPNDTTSPIVGVDTGNSSGPVVLSATPDGTVFSFGTNGWPQYNFNVPTANGSPAYPSGLPDDKVPSGQSVFADSPFGSHPSSYNDNFYSLTSGGSGPFQVVGGAGGIADGSTSQILFTQGEIQTGQAKLQNLTVGMVIGTNTSGYSIPTGTVVTGIIHQDANDPNSPIIGVNTGNANGNPVVLPMTPNGPSGIVFSFTRPLSDYAASTMANLWYTWANYYVTHLPSGTMAQSGLLGQTDNTNVLTLNNVPTGLVPGMAVTGPGISTDPANGQTTILSIDGNVLNLSQSVTASSANSSYNFALPTMTAILGSTDPNVQLLNNFDPTVGQPAGVPDVLQFAQNVYQVMSFMSSIPLSGSAPASIQLMNNVIGGNIGMVPNIGNVPAGQTAPPVKALIEVPIRDKIKSLLRGVDDFTVQDGVQNNQANWYPAPATPTGNQTFNVYNLDPFVWFVHVQLGLSGYGFSLDDDVADIGADWATSLAVSIGGLNGLPNHVEYTPGAPFGVVSASATVNSTQSNQLLNLPTNAFWSVMPDAPDTGNVGAYVNGPGIAASNPQTNLSTYGDLNAHNFNLSQPGLQNVPDGTYTYTFYGAGTPNTAPLMLSGTINPVGPYNNTSTIGIPFGTALNVTGTLNKYTQEYQQLSYLTGLTPPAIGTTVNGTLSANLIDIVNGFLDGSGTISGSQGAPGLLDVDGPVSATSYQNATTGGLLLPGTFDTPGKLSVTGDVTMYGASFEAVANGAGTPGTNYSQLVSSGTVNLGNSNLVLSLLGGYAPQTGDTLTIISAAKVMGTFSQGDRITVSSGNLNFVFTITYNATSVVLTYVSHLLGSGGPPNSGYVEALYTDFLDRTGNLSNPNDAGHWVNLLDNGTPATVVSNSVVRSTEGLDFQVLQLYERYLHRSADPSGLNFYVNLLQHGTTLENVTELIILSPEYRTLYGSNAIFIQSLYNNVLNRNGSASEIAFWLNVINTSGSLPVVQGFLDSIEYRTDMVDQFYSQLLNRTVPPSQGEVNFWVNSGLDILSIEVAFAASAEFQKDG